VARVVVVYSKITGLEPVPAAHSWASVVRSEPLGVPAFPPPTPQVPSVNASGRGVLVAVLLLRLLEEPQRRLLLGLALAAVLAPARHSRVGVYRGLGDGKAPGRGRAGRAAVEPGLDVGELLQVDARVQGHAGPAQQGDVGYGIPAAPGSDDEITALQPRVENAVQPLRLAHVPLRGVRDLLPREPQEVVGLALPGDGGQEPRQSAEEGGASLHRAEAAVLPADPGLALVVLVGADGEGQAVLRVVAAGEVAEDGVALEDGGAAAVVVHDGGDAAVGVDGRIPRLLLDVLADVDGLPYILEPVGLLELLECDRGLVAVGRV